MTTQLRMVLDDIGAAARVAPPAGLVLRAARADVDDDVDAWVSLMDGAIGSWTRHTARELFFADPELLPSGVLLLTDGATPVATASAKRRPADPPGTGYLHMVAVAPSRRSQGLGAAITAAALEVMRADGCTSALLDTDDERLPAIAAYLRMGFTPMSVDDDHPARWDAALSSLGARP